MKLSKKSIGSGTLLNGLLIVGIAFLLFQLIRSLSQTGKPLGWNPIPNPGTGTQATQATETGIVQTIIRRAKQQGADCTTAEIIAGQAAHETGNFTSPVFIDRNNAFGMKKGTIEDFEEDRGPLDTSEYAAYPSIENSVDDLYLWLYLKDLPLRGYRTAAEYVSKIKAKSYFEDNEANYRNGVERAMDRHLAFNLECGELPIFKIG